MSRATLRYRYFVLIQNIAEVLTPKPPEYPENGVQDYMNFTNICSYEMLSSLFDRGYLELHGDMIFCSDSKYSGSYDPKTTWIPSENGVQDYMNFTNICLYEVLTSLFDRGYLELHWEMIYFVLIQNIAEVMTLKPSEYPENGVPNYKNFTNIWSYEVLSSLFGRWYLEPVSYTHLTLPTNYSV